MDSNQFVNDLNAIFSQLKVFAISYLPKFLMALLIFAAAVVLITPGILTDMLGLFLLVPPGRAVVRKKLREALRRRFDARNVTVVYRDTDTT